MALARSIPIHYDALLTISPLDLFLEQLSTDNAETRVDAMRRCYVVANAIGREETLAKLIPHLATHVANVGDGNGVTSSFTTSVGGGNTSMDGSTPEGGNVSMDGSSSAVPSSPNMEVNNGSHTHHEEEDEILLILAEQLGQMVIGGLIPGYRANGILTILERLAGVEETVVRNRAVESMNAVLSHVLSEDPSPSSTTDEKDAESRARAICMKTTPPLLIAMARRLGAAEWFTARVSACGVLPAIYRYFFQLESIQKQQLSQSQISSQQQTLKDLRTIYRQLAEDDTPMVRRSAGTHLGRFIEAVAGLGPGSSPCALGQGIFGKNATTKNTVASANAYKGITSSSKNYKNVADREKEIVLEDMVPLFRALTMDEQDSVRLLAVSNGGSVACALSGNGTLCGRVVLPVVKAGCLDLSWRVRQNLAKDFYIVTHAQGYTEPSNATRLNESFQCYSSLLQDIEGEVRAAAVKNIARMAQLGGPELFSTHISPVLPNLGDDPVEEVRKTLAQTLMECCDPSICSALTDRIILQDFRPLLEGFLSDEFPEVQLHILSKLSSLSRLFTRMDAIVTTVLTMTTAQNWRVREAVARILPHLAEARGVNFFEDHLREPWINLLLDQVADVRTACVSGVSKLLSVAGAPWMQREMLPHYVAIYDESVSYLSRITVLRSYAELASPGVEGNMTPGLIEDTVTQLLRGLNDPVANVRMVAARGLTAISAVCEEAILNARIRPALNARVSEDEDEDCKYYLQIALDACG
eukprot:CAMPEP_0184864192 /NCGR_PEP_ID=MMETSP0580-20130426/14082_1 /TAXON_ID=1118495 /ORGANISM="Dactyliosolen fragilissimus" /LENGTH=755 /DNA_ID=CAMNT_0027362877 /DNA_START=172 /DNA_END=2439 /DNA_ORIENTATION=-